MSEVNQLAPGQSAEESKVVTLSLSDLLDHMAGHWKLILILALIGTLGGFLYSSAYSHVPIYSAKSVIFVINKDNIVLEDLSLGSSLTADYVRVFNMWELQERVITKLGLPYSYKELSQMVTASTIDNTHMIQITVTDSDPKEAAQIANAYAAIGSEYIAETMSVDKPNLMSAALVPSNPINAMNPVHLLVGALLGLGIGVAILYLIVAMDDKVRSIEDVRYLTGMVTLSVVPKNESVAKGSGHYGSHSGTHSSSQTTTAKKNGKTK